MCVALSVRCMVQFSILMWSFTPNIPRRVAHLSQPVTRFSPLPSLVRWLEAHDLSCDPFASLNIHVYYIYDACIHGSCILLRPTYSIHTHGEYYNPCLVYQSIQCHTYVTYFFLLAVSINIYRGIERGIELVL